MVGGRHSFRKVENHCSGVEQVGAECDSCMEKHLWVGVRKGHSVPRVQAAGGGSTTDPYENERGPCCGLDWGTPQGSYAKGVSLWHCWEAVETLESGA